VGLPCIALPLLLLAGAGSASAQSLPNGVHIALSADGQERFADRLTNQLRPNSNPDEGDVEGLLRRWERATGGPQSGPEWLAVARLWLRAREGERAAAALRQASTDIPPGLYKLESARIGFLTGAQAASTWYWEACAVADDESSLEAWLDIEVLATPAEVEAWDAFRRLPVNQRDDCAFFRRFWAERASASGMDVDERVRVHYDRLRYALRYYSRRGRAQDAGTSGRFNSRLGRESRPQFDDRGLLYLRLGPPDETASFFGDECYEPNVSWNYRFPGGDRMYHLSPMGGVDNWWLIANLAEVFRCPVGANGRIIRDRNPMVALPPNLVQIPPEFLQEIYLSRAGLDPEYARMAHQFMLDRSAEQLDTERDLTWASGLYAIAEVPERPDVKQDVNFVMEWLAYRLPTVEQTRVWLLVAISGEDLDRVREAGESANPEVIISLLDDVSGEHHRFTGEMGPREPGSDIVVRLPVDLEPGPYSAKVIVRVGEPRDPTDMEAASPSGGYVEVPLDVRDFSGVLPRLSDIAVSPDSGGSWAQVDQVALSPSPAHVTNAQGRLWVYFEAYNLTPGGAYLATVNLDPGDDGTPFDLEFSGTARAEGRVVTRSGLRLDLSDSPPGRYTLTLVLRDLATGRTALPARTWIEIRRPETLVGAQP
jgi:hypothetical protein